MLSMSTISEENDFGTVKSYIRLTLALPLVSIEHYLFDETETRAFSRFFFPSLSLSLSVFRSLYIQL